MTEICSVDDFLSYLKKSSLYTSNLTDLPLWRKLDNNLIYFKKDKEFKRPDILINLNDFTIYFCTPEEFNEKEDIQSIYTNESYYVLAKILETIFSGTQVFQGVPYFNVQLEHWRRAILKKTKDTFVLPHMKKPLSIYEEVIKEDSKNSFCPVKNIYYILECENIFCNRKTNKVHMLFKNDKKYIPIFTFSSMKFDEPYNNTIYLGRFKDITKGGLKYHTTNGTHYPYLARKNRDLGLYPLRPDNDSYIYNGYCKLYIKFEEDGKPILGYYNSRSKEFIPLFKDINKL